MAYFSSVCRDINPNIKIKCEGTIYFRSGSSINGKLLVKAKSFFAKALKFVKIQRDIDFSVNIEYL